MAFHLSKRLLVVAVAAGVSWGAFATAATTAATSHVNTTALHVGKSYDRFIISYRKGSAEAGDSTRVLQSVDVAMSRGGLTGIVTRSIGTGTTRSYLRKLATGADLVRTPQMTESEATTFMQALASEPDVAHVEPDVMMHAVHDYRSSFTQVADFTPNDPHYAAYQWDLRAGDGSMETVGSDTTAYANRGGADTVKAWNLADGQGVIVAVLDTGITHHPDLDTSLGDAGYDFISEAFISGRAADGRAAGGWDLGDWTNEEPWESQCTDAKSPPEASSWHGTHVSGTIAELTDNGVGLAGSAYDARVLPVRVLGHCGGRTSDIVDAIEWASGGHVDGISDNANPVSVISMSIGGTGTCSSSDATGVAIADAISRGVAVVVAAGNEGIDASNDSPASCPGAIAVASVGISGKRAFYSNFGSTVALAAPGGGMYANDASSGTPADYVEAGFVWSTVNGSATSPDESNYGYGGMAGTSQATPHVSGAVALVVGAVKAAGLPALTPAQIRSLLTSTARAFPTTPDQPVGAGIVDVNAAVTEAIGGDAGGGDGGNAGGATVLNNGDTLHGLAGAAGDQFLYQLDVPQGTSALVLRTFGGSGDVSLYAKRDVAPTTTDYERAAAHIGNNESVVITHPASGTYYLLISGVKAFNGLTLQASYVGGTP